MATALRSRLALSLLAELSPGLAGVAGGAVINAFENAVAADLPDGTAAGQADRLYYAERTLAASASEDLDLAGVLEDIFGNVLTFAKVKAIFIKNVSAAAARLETGPKSSNGWGVNAIVGATAHRLTVSKDGSYAAYDDGGWAVTAGTGDLLQVTNGSGSNTLTYRIAILGTSA